MTDLCVCGHALDAHDSELGYCDVRFCRCVHYVSDQDEQDDVPEAPAELAFGEDDEMPTTYAGDEDE